MYKRWKLSGFLLLLIIFLGTCNSDKNEILLWQQPEGANLRFDIQLEPEMYRLSNFGEPPQMALWLENETGNVVRTLWVSNRLARGVWVGKVVCPTALPYWISRRGIETGGGLPSFLKPLPDGITGATPKDKLSVYVKVPQGSTWRYFLELNVSGDYNETFTASQSNGSPDPDGNGQPSLIYSGYANAIPDWSNTASILGRTRQLVATSEITPDLNGLTTANQVLRELKVTYYNPAGGAQLE